MAKVVDLIYTVMLSVPDAPEPVVARAYSEAARQFCTDTLAWRDGGLYLAYLNMPGPLGEFAVAVDDQTEVFDAARVEFRGRSLEKSTLGEIRRREQRGRPSAFTISSSRLFVSPDPGVGHESAIRADFILRPRRGATEIPETVADRWGDIIDHGALSRLLAVPGKPWTEYGGAGYYAGLFQQAIIEWKSKAADEGMVGVPRRVAYGGY